MPPGKSLAILCSSISWQQSEKARLKEIDDKRREVEAAKSAELQKAAAASALSVNTVVTGQELEGIGLEHIPIAYGDCNTIHAAVAIAPGLAVSPQPSLNSTPCIPPAKAEPTTKPAISSAPHVDFKSSTAEPAIDQPPCNLPSIKSHTPAQPSKPFSLQKTLQAVAPSRACALPHAASQDDDFQPEKALVKRFVKRESINTTVVGPKGSNNSLAACVATSVDALGVPHDAAATMPASDATPLTPAVTSDVSAAAASANVSTASSAEPETKESLSRIYICSRTHSQLSQLIKGLKSTVYTPNMAVLGSREQMCIHPTVMFSETKNEDCSKLIGGSDGSGCSFFQAANILASHPSMRVVWDIEDIVTKGRQFRACPYFTAKDIAEEADVVFCPYNYLIDKLIRESSGIQLKNNIVIFDEAHNLEDQCREAASFVVTITLLNAAIDMFEACQHFPNCPADVTALRTAFIDIRFWIQEREKCTSSDGSGGERILEFVADQVLQQLSVMGLTPDNVKELSSKAGKLSDWHKEVIELSEAPNAFRWVCPLDGKTHSVVPAFSVCMRTLQMMLLVSGYAHEFVTDYAICLQQKSMDAETKVNIWCLNPGVAFRDLREQCRSVVLTSGSLCDCCRHLCNRNSQLFIDSS